MKNFGMVPTPKTKKEKTFDSWMQEVTRGMRGGEGIGDIGRQRGVEKENKFTLGTERCENIRNLYIK